MADDQAAAVLRLVELQQQGQALLLDGQDPGGQEGRQQPACLRAHQEQALVFLCETGSIHHVREATAIKPALSLPPNKKPNSPFICEVG